MGYLQNTVKNFGWVGAFRVSSRGMAFVRTAVLARILSPAQFGIYGIVLIALALLELLTETGINIFLIQEDDDIDGYINTAWVVSIIRGIVISALIFTSAPFIGKFFNAYEVISLLHLVAIVPLVRGFINPSIVKIQKSLQFRKDFFLRTTVFLLDSLAAILLALVLKSPSSLVFGLIIGAVVETFLSFILVRPLPRFSFDKKRALKVVGRGKWVTLAGIFDYLAKQGDNLIVGKMIGTTQLGFYQMAYTFSTIPLTEISDTGGKVSFPVFARIYEDRKRLLRAYLLYLAAVTALVVPVSLVIYFFPETIVKLVLGNEWLPIVEALRILAVFGVIRAISATMSPLFLGVKKQNVVTGVTFIRLVTLALCVYPLTVNYGIVGTSIAALISSIVPLPFIIYNLAKVLR